MSVQTRPLEFRVSKDGIYIFEFNIMERNAADLFVKIVQAGGNDFPDKLRIMFDSSRSEAPTPYFIRTSAKLTKETNFPRDSKSAYVVGSKEKEVWAHIVRRYQPTTHPVRNFIDQESATKWLLED